MLRKIDIRAMFDKPCCQLVVPVVRGGQKRGPAVFRRLIDVRAGCNQKLRGFQIAFACGKNHRGQTAAAAADQTGNDDIGVIGFCELLSNQFIQFLEILASCSYLWPDELENGIYIRQSARLDDKFSDRGKVIFRKVGQQTLDSLAAGLFRSQVVARTCDCFLWPRPNAS